MPPSIAPDPILFSTANITIHWYGFLLAVGAFFAYIVLLRLAKHYHSNMNDASSLFFWTILSGLVCARIYHVFLEYSYYMARPAEVLKVWNGGMALHGALIGGALAIWVFTKRRGQSFWWTADLLAPAIIIGQAIGRWGNYFNQELFGRPTNLPWGIPINPRYVPDAFADATYFHPTFLYESLWSLLVFFILIGMHRLRIFSERPRLFSGAIVITYVILYSVGRILTELLRIDPTPEVLGIRLPIVVSAILILIGVATMPYLFRKWKNEIAHGDV